MKCSKPKVQTLLNVPLYACPWYQGRYPAAGGADECQLESWIMAVVTCVLFVGTFLACMSVRRLLMMSEAELLWNVRGAF